MILKSTVPFVIITLLLAACATPTTIQPAGTENPTTPPLSTSTSVTYPQPGFQPPVPTTSIYPVPGTPTVGIPLIPLSGYEPQPGDDKLRRGLVDLELDKSRLILAESQPLQVSLILNGNLSTPCQQLRVVVSPADANREINLEVYSLVNTSQVCITVIKPFSATIALGSYFISGHYSVFVNGALVGEFDA